jgi:D-alanyl-D-alanine dipeptidase
MVAVIRFDYPTRRGRCRYLALALGALLVATATRSASANPALVDIKTVDPSIVIDLRYATPNNVTGHVLYPHGMRALVLPSVARQLASAQHFLREYNYGLKIWDAYRPKKVQELLWRFAHKGDYIANPENSFGSTHSYGVSVDATLVDNYGRELSMPTGFDSFTPAAMLRYQGQNRAVRDHLTLLQVAMGGNNFYGLRIEWWHFTAADWKKYVPYQEAKGEKQNADKRKSDPKKLKASAQTSQNSKI